MGTTPGGIWSDRIWCPYGTRVNGYKLRIEPFQGARPDTGLNGIQLSCNDGSVSERIIGSFGNWQDWVYCKDGAFVLAFDVLSLDSIRSPIEEITGANNVKMMCNNGEELIVDGLNFGTWEGYKSCPVFSYLCGVQAQIHKFLGGSDGTEVNRIEFQCCPEKGKGITAQGFK